VISLIRTLVLAVLRPNQTRFAKTRHLQRRPRKIGRDFIGSIEPCPEKQGFPPRATAGPQSLATFITFAFQAFDLLFRDFPEVCHEEINRIPLGD
jgi:hypothetical protein